MFQTVADLVNDSRELSTGLLCAIYAWISSSPHGLMVGIDAVMMAVALEGAKPLAVASALAALRSWAIVRGLALLALAAAAIAFSLTSELALIAGNRGDLAAKRSSVIKQHDAQGSRMQAAAIRIGQLAPRESCGVVCSLRATSLFLRARYNGRAGCVGALSCCVLLLVSRS